MRLDFRQVAGMAVDLLFPQRCVHCGQGGRMLCERCIDDATPMDGAACDRCGRVMPYGSRCEECQLSPPPINRLVSAYQFDGAVRSAIHALKYEGIRALGPVLGDLLAEHPYVTRGRFNGVLAVPIHRSRLRGRGYNQSDFLAARVAEAGGTPLLSGLLMKHVKTPSQVSLTSRQRTTSQRDSFKTTGDAKGARLLLVDDVATTGSTLNECARALKLAGAEWVGALTLARET